MRAIEYRGGHRLLGGRLHGNSGCGGTAIGGISGPLLFGNFINSGNRQLVALGFFIGAAVMAVGGIAELLLGVKAERCPLEDIAAPLSVMPTETNDLRRYRPGLGGLYSPGMPLPPPATHDEGRLTSEIDSLTRVLEEHGATDRDELARLVGARYWGPGLLRRGSARGGGRGPRPARDAVEI